MRPGDHPEFFRFPAPEGRSRESTIVLDREGRFKHDGAIVEHPGMARAFASWIGVHPDNGRFILNNGYDWTYFTVEDAPFFVLSVREAGEGLVLALSDGTESVLDPTTLREGEAGALYATVKDGKFRARFSRAAMAALAPWLVTQENGQICLEIAGRCSAIETSGMGS